MTAAAACAIAGTTDAAPRIESIAARAVLAPLARPIRTAVGHVPAAPLVLIDVRGEDGVVGRSYVFQRSAVVIDVSSSFINWKNRMLRIPFSAFGDNRWDARNCFHIIDNRGAAK